MGRFADALRGSQQPVDRQASMNIYGTQDVSPDMAIEAINQEPLTRIPPQTGMFDKEIYTRARTQEQAAVVQTTPSLSKFAADPARAAAIRDDLGPLKALDSVGQVFQDSFDGVVDAMRNAVAAGREADELWKQGKPVQSVVRGLTGATFGLVASPFAAITNPIARGLERNPNVVFYENAVDERGYPIRGPVVEDATRRAELATESANTIVAEAFMLANKPGFQGAPAAGRTRPSAAPEGTLQLPPPNRPTPRPGANPNMDAVRGAVAELDAQAVAKYQEGVAESKTFSRSPALMAEYLHQQTPNMVVNIDPDVLLELRAQGHVVFPERLPEIEQAAARGEMVKVPYSQYLAATSGQPYANDLNAATIFREGGLSVNEAKELGDGALPPETPSGEGGARLAEAPPEPRALPPETLPEEFTFARSLAESTQAEVQELVAELKLKEIYSDNKAVGATKKNFERYSEGIENHIANVEERLFERAYRQVRQERTPKWKETVAQRAAEVEQELAQLPEMRAWSALTRGKDPLGAPHERPFKLRLDDSLTNWAKDLGLPSSMFGREGMFIDEAAEVFGYPNGVQLITALSQLQARMGDKGFQEFFKSEIQSEAAERTREELGFDNSPESMRDAASEMITSPEIVDYLQQDLRKFAEANGLPLDKSMTKEFAAERFAQRPVSEVINLREMERNLARDGQKLETALLKGDIPEAFRWKQNQFLHAVELQLAHKFLKTYNRLGRNAKKWARKRNPPKSLAPATFDRIHELLIQHKIPTKRSVLQQNGDPIPSPELQRALGNMPLSVWIDDQQGEVGASMEYYALPPVAIKDLTVNQFNQLQAMLDSMAKFGQREADPTIKNLVDAAWDKSAGLPDLSHDRSANPHMIKLKPLVSSKLRAFDAMNTGMEDVFDKLDGGDPNGPHSQIFKWATDAANKVDDLEEQIFSPIVVQYEKLLKTHKREFNQKIDQDVFRDPRDGVPIEMRRGDLISVLLNMGSESNRYKLAEGYNTTPEAIMELLNEHITPDMAEFAQFVWDTFDKKLFPVADANARKLRGYGLRKIEAMPVELKSGTLTGGYYPIEYDRRFSTSEQTKGEVKVKVDPFKAISTPTGFEQDRTGYTAPIKLDLGSVLRENLSEEFTRIAYGEFIPNAIRFFNSSKIKELWNRKVGHEYYREIRPWLERQVMLGGPTNFADQAVAQLRHNLTVSKLAGKASVLQAQLLGMATVAAEIGPRWYADGYINFYAALLTGRLNREYYSKMPELRRRHDNMNQDLRDTRRAVSRLNYGTLGVVAARNKIALKLMDVIGTAEKFMVSGAAAVGAYRKARFEMGMSEGDAARYAEKVVRQTQGSGRAKDLVPFQNTSNEFQKLFAFAYTPVARIYNMQKGAIRDLKAGRFRMGANKLFWLFLVLPIAEAIREGMWPNEDDKKDPVRYITGLLRSAALRLAGRHIALRDLTSGLDKKAQGERPWDISNAYVELVTSITNLYKPNRKGEPRLAGPNNTRRWVRAWTDFLGMGGVLPASDAVGNAGQFVADTQMGQFTQRLPNSDRQRARKKVKPENAWDWVEGLTTGRLEEDQ